MMTQLLTSGPSIDPSWLFGIGVIVIGFFMVRTLNKIETRLEKQDRQINLLTNIQLQICSRLGFDDNYFEDLAKALNKINEK